MRPRKFCQILRLHACWCRLGACLLACCNSQATVLVCDAHRDSIGSFVLLSRSSVPIAFATIKTATVHLLAPTKLMDSSSDTRLWCAVSYCWPSTAAEFVMFVQCPAKTKNPSISGREHYPILNSLFLIRPFN